MSGHLFLKRGALLQRSYSLSPAPNEKNRLLLFFFLHTYAVGEVYKIFIPSLCRGSTKCHFNSSTDILYGWPMHFLFCSIYSERTVNCQRLALRNVPSRTYFSLLSISNKKLLPCSIVVSGLEFVCFAWHEGAVWVSNHPVILSLASFSRSDSYLADFMCTLYLTEWHWQRGVFPLPRHGTEKHKGITYNQHWSTQDWTTLSLAVSVSKAQLHIE